MKSDIMQIDKQIGFSSYYNFYQSIFQKYRILRQKMNRQDMQQIVIIDDQVDLIEVHHPHASHDHQNIFVFDDEERDYQEDCRKLSRSKSKNKNELITQVQYKKRLSQLSDNIIMQNLINFNNSKKQEKSYFQEAKERRKSFNRQGRKSLRPIEAIVNDPRQQVLKVTFQDEIVQPRKNSKQKQTGQHYDCRNKDQIVETNKMLQLQKAKEKIGLNGIDLKRKSQLKIEQDKNKHLLKVSNFREFLYSQLRPNYNIFIQIRKTQDGLINSTYKFYFQQTKKFILSCQKQGFTKYVFSTSQIHFNEEHVSFLAKMEASFFGGEFLLYDSGEDSSKTKLMENYKKQMAYISYNKDDDEPRKIHTLISTCDNSSTDFTIVDNESNVLQKRWSDGKHKNITSLYSKSANQDAADRCFKMDFKGVAGIPSIKNFILESEEYPDALIFGRKDKDQYIMRVKSPFSVVQAAAIAMSSIHYKFI